MKNEKVTPERKSFNDKYGTSKFHEELPQIPLEDVIGIPYLIKEARIVKGFKSKFGKSDFSLLLLEDLSDGELATTLCGGMVVVEKVQRALDENSLPLVGTIVKVTTGDGANEYYDIT